MLTTVFSWLEPIKSHPVVKSIIDHQFICGIILGIAVIYLLRFIVWMCFRKKYCSSIQVAGKSGEISISNGAIASVIIHESAVLKCLKIKRVRINQVKGGYQITIRAILDAASGAAPALIEQLSVIVKSKMDSVFGINNVQKVSLEVINCDHHPTDDKEDDNAAEKTVDMTDDTEFFHSAGHGDRTISLKLHGSDSHTEKERE